jgi:hypothetical protein
VQHKWPEPAWIAELPSEKRGPARIKHLLNLAAAYHNDSGSLTQLSIALGKNRAHLNVARQRGRVSPEMAVQIETHLGREHFPRELFNDLFVIAEK